MIRQIAAKPADILSFCELLWIGNYWGEQTREVCLQRVRSILLSFQHRQTVIYPDLSLVPLVELHLVGFIYDLSFTDGNLISESIAISINKIECYLLGRPIPMDPAGIPHVQFDLNEGQILARIDDYPNFLNQYWFTAGDESGFTTYTRQDLKNIK